MIIISENVNETVKKLTGKEIFYKDQNIIYKIEPSDLSIRIIDRDFLYKRNADMVYMNIGDATMGTIQMNYTKVCLLLSNVYNIPFNEVFRE